jgi:hypothetical protein
LKFNENGIRLLWIDFKINGEYSPKFEFWKKWKIHSQAFCQNMWCDNPTIIEFEKSYQFTIHNINKSNAINPTIICQNLFRVFPNFSSSLAPVRLPPILGNGIEQYISKAIWMKVYTGFIESSLSILPNLPQEDSTLSLVAIPHSSFVARTRPFSWSQSSTRAFGEVNKRTLDYQKSSITIEAKT